jgi:hypothetical protein
VRFWRCASLWTALFLIPCFSTVSFAQAPGQVPGQAPMPNPNIPQGPSPDQETQDRLQKEMAKKANQERQAQLKKDTENLFKLATELKQYVDKSNENTLSVDVIRKADEIEKLAHSVKEKMKGQ